MATTAEPTNDHADAGVAGRVTGVLDASLALVRRLRDNTGRLVELTRHDAADLVRDSEALYGMVAGQLRSAGALARATPRVARVIGDGGRILASYRLHQLRTPAMDDGAAAAARVELDRAGAARLHQLCVDLRQE